ncbi:P-loop containing nucleoside triphosphate hydrolase protein [Rhizophagus clarus]|uniref:P-loop containing nucleoside triphosphate hydrolase protein n=1 Tax=Rhizophagus clarus TaxID=94130 RepID=A0A8H3M0R9_9GLOM|nr:P-loop containing nucleoside triphosphate hydrolase protein [Rhizophagus clarus]
MVNLDYVSVPCDAEDFGTLFENAINFTFEENISLTKQLLRKIGDTDDKFEISEWKRALDIFKRIAEKYRTKYNRPPGSGHYLRKY